MWNVYIELLFLVMLRQILDLTVRPPESIHDSDSLRSNVQLSAYCKSKMHLIIIIIIITVTENNEATILWDMPIQTDREIKANRPDLVVKDKKTENLPTN